MPLIFCWRFFHCCVSAKRQSYPAVLHNTTKCTNEKLIKGALATLTQKSRCRWEIGILLLEYNNFKKKPNTFFHLWKGIAENARLLPTQHLFANILFTGTLWNSSPSCRRLRQYPDQPHMHCSKFPRRVGWPTFREPGVCARVLDAILYCSSRWCARDWGWGVELKQKKIVTMRGRARARSAVSGKASKYLLRTKLSCEHSSLR